MADPTPTPQSSSPQGLRPSVAINFVPEAFDTKGARLMGFQSAGESFLAAMARHSRAPVLGCYAPMQENFAAFDAHVQANAPRRRATEWARSTDPNALSKFGCLYISGPTVPALAWRRRRVGDSAYSLCGLTHTIASETALKAISDLVQAPVHPWDALICTSEAVKASALRIIDGVCDYLGDRLGAKRPPLPELPVIPLGIDVSRFAPRSDARAAWRKKLQIGDDEIAFLYFGRLNFVAKAHPVPMYLALERAAQRTGRKLTLIQAGWFATEGHEKLFREAAKQYAPSVNCVFTSGRAEEARAEIWHAADVFISLSDNIQESFGLTPLEAMAAGLPVIVSDWDGYRQTVEHGKSGLMVPTALPGESSGLEMAWRLLNGFEDYNRFVGTVSQVTAVDIEATAAACVQLIESPELRQTLGGYGRQRADAVFDWRHVIASYEELWTELAARRAAAVQAAPANGSDLLPPFQGNPMRLFANFASRIIGDDARVELATAEPGKAMTAIVGNQMNITAEAYLVPPDRRAALLQRLANGPQTVGELIAQSKPLDPDRVRRTVMWLLKFGILRLA